MFHCPVEGADDPSYLPCDSELPSKKGNSRSPHSIKSKRMVNPSQPSDKLLHHAPLTTTDSSNSQMPYQAANCNSNNSPGLPSTNCPVISVSSHLSQGVPADPISSMESWLYRDDNIDDSDSQSDLDTILGDEDAEAMSSIVNGIHGEIEYADNCVNFDNSDHPKSSDETMNSFVNSQDSPADESVIQTPIDDQQSDVSISLNNLHISNSDQLIITSEQTSDKLSSNTNVPTSKRTRAVSKRPSRSQMRATGAKLLHDFEKNANIGDEELNSDVICDASINDKKPESNGLSAQVEDESPNLITPIIKSDGVAIIAPQSEENPKVIDCLFTNENDKFDTDENPISEIEFNLNENDDSISENTDTENTITFSKDDTFFDEDDSISENSCIEKYISIDEVSINGTNNDVASINDASIVEDNTPCSEVSSENHITGDENTETTAENDVSITNNGIETAGILNSNTDNE